MNLAFALHLGATFYMVGVIWTIQLVHYPMLGRVGDAFDDCQRFHLSKMGLIVGPPMLLEAVTAAWLLFDSPRPLVYLATALLTAIWAVTFFVSVPLHDQLSAGFDPAAHRRLVDTNWWRTIAWTTRAVLLLALVKR